jgi:hypothetical protein
MSQQFDLNLDSLEQARPAARAVAFLFGGALIALSGITTAAFFGTYAPGIYDLWFPALSPIMSALTGVLVFEIAGLSWQYLRAHAATTRAQLTVAAVGSWAGMVGGLLTTIVYFSLSNGLLSSALDAPTLEMISLIGGTLIVWGVALNFGLTFVWSQTAAGQQSAQSAATIRALKVAAAEQVQDATTRATLQRTLADIGRALPAASTRQGAANAAHYLAETFDAPDGDEHMRFVDIGTDGRAPAGADKWAARAAGRASVNGHGDIRPT